jgi:N-acetylneuraminic acid mutarotase
VVRQEFTSVGYAMTAANVANGAVTAAQLADGAVTAAKLAPGAVTSSAISSGAVGPDQMEANAAAKNLNASGALILSANENAANLLAAGFQKIGKILAGTDKWVTNWPFCPNPKANHAAVWTGSEMIVWGGYDYSKHFDKSGAIYNLSSDSWSSISNSNAPTYQSGYNEIRPPAIWTGQFMIVRGNMAEWKIYNRGNNSWKNLALSNMPSINDFATYTWTGTELIAIGRTASSSRRYDLASDRWKNMTITNAPLYHTAVWTGSELILWGGTGSALSSGGIYNPATDTWRAMSVKNAPSARSAHQAAWTGKAMIVWGGQTTSNPYGDNSGGIYDPFTDTWKPISLLNAPSGRRQFTAFWTGQEFVVFGGIGRIVGSTSSYALESRTDGGKYNPVSDTWTPIDAAPFAPLIGYSTVWTGSELIVWGGGSFDSRTGTQFPYLTQNDFLNMGMRFNPSTGEWRHLACTPVGRIGHSAIWTGSEFIVWGGSTNTSESFTMDGFLRDGARFNPVKGTWQPVSSLNAPSKRKNHQALWTGKEMVIWGGVGALDGVNYHSSMLQGLATGARYNPALDRWFAMETNGAPSARTDFSMIWSGKEAIIFGGYTSYKPIGYLNSGGRYDPESDSWRSISPLNAPTPRRLHAAAWTGEEMIVWGGTSSASTTSPSLQDSGARYNPVSNTWTTMSTVGAPRGNLTLAPAALWTGHEILLWGHGIPFAARYQPAANRWEPMNTSGLPSELLTGSIDPVWTGEEMLVSGGARTKIGHYNPGTDQWTITSLNAGPQVRKSTKVVWTGNEMILFGGQENTALNSKVLRLQTAAPVYLYGKP